MHRAIKIAGFTIGGLGLAALAALGVSRVVRNYHTEGTLFPVRNGNMPTRLPKAALGEREPSLSELTLIEMARTGLWPVGEDMTYYTEGGKPYLEFKIEGQTVCLGYAAGSQTFMITNYEGPGKDDLWGTDATFEQFLKKVREAS